MTNTKLIVGAAEIGKAIASIQVRGAKLDASIQIAGVSVLAHCAEHNDCTLADRLVLAMPKGSRRQVLVEWMLANGKMRLLSKDTEADAIKNGRIFKVDATRALNLEAAEEKPWYEFKKQPEVMDAFDAQAAVKSVLTRLAAAGRKGMTIENKALALAEAQALVQALSA